MKRNVDTKSDKSFNIKIPSALSEVSKEYVHKSFAAAVAASPHAGEMNVFGDKLKMSADKARSLFQLVVDKIVVQLEECINTVKKLKTTSPVSLILMVGGFSESPFVQQSIKSRYCVILVL